MMKRIQNLVANKSEGYLINYALLIACTFIGSYILGVYWTVLRQMTLFHY